MLLHALSLLAGLVTLVAGSDRTVKGASMIARDRGVSAFFVGVTLVAVGSSLPEVATSAYGAAYGQGPLVIGHIVGSATSQITLGIGLVAILAPLPAARSEVLTYGVGMVVAMATMLLVVSSGRVGRLQGVLMALAYLGFIAARYELTDDTDVVGSRVSTDETLSHPVLWAVAGLVLVIVGGHLLVTGARGVADALGAPTYLLGLLTGLGTTTPEIVVAALAVRREEGGIAVGTLFGSNITDPLFSLGVGAAVAPLAVENVDATLLSIGYMLLVSATVVVVFYRREEVGRWAGAACLALYVPTLFLG
ncbi:sodium:calcium antiporter [Halolamina salifodinae]|uniref:Cation:H+ antiporter n=1 Tax=Halolamina salifodinae TaxID=1202767 RepID=A0A8T4GWW4_9EURY|nr:sodium:calcium antiporter [Halolamina salifodinae]MBP1986553.1 cation:H+ antiporter [Halolamina salifodinae]